MADPGPVAQTFFVDDELRNLFALDAIVTLVDAKHVSLHLEDSRECREQIAFADVLVLNKADLVSPGELDRLEERVRSMNAMARVLRSTNAAIPIADVLGIGGFDLERAVAQKPTFLLPEYPFEWAGTFELQEGSVSLHLDDGPDATLDLLVTKLSAGEEAHAPPVRERIARAWSKADRKHSPGAALVPEGGVVRLDLQASGEKRFTLDVPKSGVYGVYTQHLPSESKLRLTGPGELHPRAEQEFAAAHSHDDQVTSVGIHLNGAVDGDKLEKWISKLLREQGPDIFRMKGIINLRGSNKRYIFQGVHMLFDGKEDREWASNETPASDMVFIGRRLDRSALTRGFEQCLA